MRVRVPPPVLFVSKGLTSIRRESFFRRIAPCTPLAHQNGGAIAGAWQRSTVFFSMLDT